MITTRFLFLFCLSLSLVGSAFSQDSDPAQDDRQCIFGDSFPGAEAPATVKVKQAFFYREKSPRHKGCPTQGLSGSPRMSYLGLFGPGQSGSRFVHKMPRLSTKRLRM